jgi:orotate phosphoribosyltransferase
MERMAMEHLGTPDRPTGPMPELIWLRKIIVERALTRGDYVLSGGIRSDYWIDKFSLFSDPQVLRRIVRLFTPVIAEVNPSIIGGTELGGVIVATAVSQMSNIPMIVVRKKPKGYGASAGEYVEGPYIAGQHVLLLEDVITNGHELMSACLRLEQLGLRVTPCAVISRGLAPIRALIQFSLPQGNPPTGN